MRRLLTLIGLLLLIALVIPAIQAGEPTLSFEHWYDTDAVKAAMDKLVKKYPTLAELSVIGQSEEGRDIWLFTINNKSTGGDTEKPAVYVDGTIHGNEIQATEVCLYLASYLLDSYGDNPKVKALVDSRAFYIIPIANVDNRYHFFADASGYNRGRTARVPYDDDRDGMADEDDGEDLDGDGEILRMRIADPYGGWKDHPDDDRVMIRTKPGELGQWRKLGSEGIDNDGDGRINEDGPGYLDMNRNYGFHWQPPYVQSGSGDFPMSAKVNKAISDFVITKPNICFNFAFHNSGGLIVRGPGSKLAGRYSGSDIKVYDFFGHEGEKILPGYEYIIGGQDMYTTHGDFDEFMFSNLGIYGFVGELFMSSQEQYRAPDGKEEDESWYGGTPAIEKHKFSDHVSQGTMFKNWTKFDHPQLGEVEIGGWRSFTTRIPPTFMLPEMAHRNAALVIFVAGHTPSVELTLLEVEPLEGGLKRIRLRASNDRALPTLSRRALSKRIYRKDILRIEGNGLEVVSGGELQDALFDKVSPVKHRPNMIFTHIPRFGKRDVQWIVRGSGKATVTFTSVKAADRTLTIDL